MPASRATGVMYRLPPYELVAVADRPASAGHPPTSSVLESAWWTQHTSPLSACANRSGAETRDTGMICPPKSGQDGGQSRESASAVAMDLRSEPQRRSLSPHVTCRDHQARLQIAPGHRGRARKFHRPQDCTSCPIARSASAV